MKKFLLLTLPFHKSSSDFQRIFFDFCWKVKTIFYVSAGNFVEKYSFRKRFLFHHFRTFIEKNRQLCQTLSFGITNFIIRGHGVTFSWPLFSIYFCRGCRNYSLRDNRIALMKISFFLENLYFLFNISKIWALSFQPFIGKSPASWQNCILRVHRNFSTERKLSKLKAFSSVLEFQRKFFWKIVKNLSATFYVSVGKSFMKNIENIFSYCFFGLSANNLWSIVKKFPTGFSELNSICP